MEGDEKEHQSSSGFKKFFSLIGCCCRRNPPNLQNIEKVPKNFFYTNTWDNTQSFLNKVIY